MNWATRKEHHELAAMLNAYAVTRAKCVAFAMGMQERLGAGSRVKILDPETIRTVIRYVE